MATATTNKPSSLKGHANCPICFEVYKSPKSLPCLHTFCQVCLNTYIVKLDEKSSLENKFECPVCRRQTVSPAPGEPASSWAEKFPYNYALVSLLGNSEGQSQRCDPCKEIDVESKALKFCTNCGEYMCKECVEHHKRFKVSKSHSLLNIDEMDARQKVKKSSTSMCNTMCSIHDDKPIEYFCKDHNSLCCSTCAIVDHRKCSEIAEIKTASRNIRSTSSRETEALKINLKLIKDHVEAITTNMKEDHDKLNKQIAEIPRRASTLKERLIAAVEALEKQITTETDAIKKSEDIKLSDKTEMCSRLTAAVDGSIIQLESVLRQGSESDLFITVHKIEQQVQDYEKMMKDEHENAKYLSVGMKVEDQVEIFLQSKELVKLEAQEVRCNLPTLPTLRPKPKKKEYKVECMGEKILNTSGKTPRYSGAALLDSDLLVLADNDNDRLCLFDQLTFKSELNMGSTVWKITKYTDTSVAVPLPNKQEIKIVEVRAGPILEVTRSISTLSKCWCLSTISQDELVFISDCWKNPKFGILSVDGKERSKTETDTCGRKFEGFWHMCLNIKRDKIYQSCNATKTLYCFYLNGNACFKYTNESLKNPGGVDVDGDDNVYVCGHNTNNIHQLTPDGFLIRIIVSDILENPLNICFLHNGEEFVVFSTLEKKRDTLVRFKLL